MGIASATHNSALLSVVRDLWDRGRGAIWKRMEHHFQTPELRAAVLRDHRAILEALEARDEKDARTSMRRHLGHVEREFERGWELLKEREVATPAKSDPAPAPRQRRSRAKSLDSGDRSGHAIARTTDSFPDPTTTAPILWVGTAGGAKGAEVGFLGTWRTNDAADPLPQDDHVEIDEQPERQPGRLQVRKDLRRVDRREALGGLDFHEQTMPHEQVPPRLTDRDALVGDRYSDLTQEAYAALCELSAKGFLVEGLEKPGTQRAMNLDGRSDDRFGQAVQSSVWLCHAPFSLRVLRVSAVHNTLSAQRSLMLRPSNVTAQ